MGQQQLLLVILVTIIVGIAAVVAVNTFSSSAKTAAEDAVRNDLASIAASAQGYYMRPEMLGGGGRDFTNIEWDDIAFSGTLNSDDDMENENGVYAISSSGETEFLVTANVNNSSESIIIARICVDDIVIGDVNGSTPANCDGSDPS